MQHRQSAQDCAHALRAVLESGNVTAKDTSVFVYNLDVMRSRVDEALGAFPGTALHAVAVKANPLPPVLRLLRQQDPRVGCEAASLPELHLALDAGFAPERVVFDSPAKTEEEIRFALEWGVRLNVDNFQELERVARAVDAMGHVSGRVGLRVNPQVGAGAIAATSVAGAVSKFGVPVSERERILDAYARHPWLDTVHGHIGSQGCSMEQLLAGAGALLELARAVGGQVRCIDLGGGLPVTYSDDAPKDSIILYAAALKTVYPQLFSGDYQVITEFGRAIHANAGFAATRVEYVKPRPGGVMAVTHLGADAFLRECYNPADWHHDLCVADANGILKQDAEQPTDVAGPLCFQGDFIARDRALPAVQPGDWIIIRDAGAYSLCMWSRYNSRQMPAVLGVRGSEVEVLKARESVEDVLRFWG